MSTNTSSSAQCSVPAVFPFSVRLGLIFIAQAAGLSAIAIICLLSYIVYGEAEEGRHAPLVDEHPCALVFSQFVGVGVDSGSRYVARSSAASREFTSDIGGLLDIQWIKDSVIAIHTFSVIVLGWRPKSNSTVAVTVLSMIWLALILLVAISLGTHKGKDYYGNTQYWCWITSAYPVQRIALEYAWMWTAALTNIVLYIPIVLVMKGFISASGGRLKVLRRSDSIRAINISESNQAIDNLATKMLWYPALYTLTVLPIAIVRWDAFLGHCIPWSATVASDFIFACSGLLNVLLFTVTRPALVPHRMSGNFGMDVRSFPNSSPPAVSHTFSSSWSSPHPAHRPEPDTTNATKITTSNIHVRFPSPVLVDKDLKLQRDKLKQYRKKIQAVLDREHEIAKQHLAAGQKDRALFALRKRRYQEGLLVKTDSQLENLEKLVSTIEFSLVEVSVVHGLQQGNEVLKEIHKEMSIEAVEKLLDETAEARAYQREIDDMLADTLTADDEDAVQEELRQLQQEAIGEQELDSDRLPSVPVAEPVSHEVEAEERLPTPTPEESRERIPIAA
ncbi:hypothetical protein EUX98_g642 [Antrodiella citrinella]|uniref:Glucose receptor Git3 N-terminal domain-containing protein n=1 Tax=Antrodiella citrinella TaxID=2447956 RepID=A0A4S4N6A4_9APHY|nr:hypothetical protein EUX98_g642 [Antrodiella citrinella]